METQKRWLSRSMFIIVFLCFSYFYLQPAALSKVTIVNEVPLKPETEVDEDESSKYLVNTPKCKIPDLDPWNKEVQHLYANHTYISCSKLPPLTYVKKNATYAVVKIAKKVAKKYSKSSVKCCYQWIERSVKEDIPDDNIIISKKCIDFRNEVVISNKTVMVTCRDKKTLYSNVHVAITIDEDKYEEVLDTRESSNVTKSIGVLIIGIDSISRLNFYRTMPETRAFLDENEWIEYKGYNKMGDNTFPNLMAMLTGKNPDYAYGQCDPTVRGKLETCPFIWKAFKKFDYITAYAEDEDKISTFNYKKKGFVNQPTDFYFKAYSHGFGKLNSKVVDDMHYCSGPEQSGERILNLAKDFSTTFLGYPIFGLFWTNSFSHNKVNSPTRLDKKVASFLEDLQDEGVLEETMVIFVSDHGMRFGPIRLTTSGWIEERLPYLYFWIPPWLRKIRPNEYNNLRANSRQLSSPYDVYMTIQDILVLSNLTYTPLKSDACPLCQSLFKKMKKPRSCEEAGIGDHWCTCNGYTPIETDDELVEEAIDETLNWIEEKIKKLEPKSKKCSHYKVNKIISASISDSQQKDSPDSMVNLLVMFETKPKAVFESTVSFTHEDNSKEKIKKSEVKYVSRLDEYKPHSGCVEDSRLKTYCYCKKNH